MSFDEGQLKLRFLTFKELTFSQIKKNVEVQGISKLHNLCRYLPYMFHIDHISVLKAMEMASVTLISLQNPCMTSKNAQKNSISGYKSSF